MPWVNTLKDFALLIYASYPNDHHLHEGRTCSCHWTLQNSIQSSKWISYDSMCLTVLYVQLTISNSLYWNSWGHIFSNLWCRYCMICHCYSYNWLILASMYNLVYWWRCSFIKSTIEMPHAQCAATCWS